MTEIPKSIAAYADECEAILSWLSTDTWLHQDEFDRRSREWRWDRTRKHRIHSYTDETIVLPFNGDPLLAILQEFQSHGMVEAQRLPQGGIEYRLNATKSVPAPVSDPDTERSSNLSVRDKRDFNDLSDIYRPIGCLEDLRG